MKAITVSIIKPYGQNCSNDGISNRFNEVLLLVPSGNVETDYRSEMPVVEIEQRPGLGPCARVVYDPLHPSDPSHGSLGGMMGGCYIACSDSRFTKAAGIYGAVALHDRYETSEQYEALSR